MDFDLLLVQKMKRGNENAFDVFVRKHYEEILKYCSFHCLDVSYAEDLTQETFLHFFEKLSNYRYMGKTKNYLYTIAGNLCRDYYKKAKESLLEEQSREFQSFTGRITGGYCALLFSRIKTCRNIRNITNKSAFGKVSNKKGKDPIRKIVKGVIL